jgi:hypothetical protein
VSQTKSVWITYAWDDNKDGDVDFVAQELIRKGLDVKLDRWNLTAGKRLWEQIESFIQDPSKSDSWLLYATQTSLGNERCREEFAYALDRALNIRGSEFPIIALFPSTVDTSLIPAGIKTRLFVSITDPDWKERIVASVEKRQPSITKPEMKPYELTIHNLSDGQYAIEVRPRAGTWVPFIMGIPVNEKDRVSPRLHYGASKRPPVGTFATVLLGPTGESVSSDGRLWLLFAANEATPTQSYYISCKELPTLLIFGVDGGQPQYQVSLQA